MNTLGSKCTSLLVVIHVIGIFSFLHVAETHAHTPHDVIRALDVSPAYQADQTLFVIVYDRGSCVTTVHSMVSCRND
jgi:hypothetical protein